jgi:transposase-like protein
MSEEIGKTAFEDITSEDLASLLPYQKEALTRKVRDYLNANQEAQVYHLDVCPKCGKAHPNWAPGGKANSGKPMVRCDNCGRRTVVDSEQLTYYSHQDRSKWDQLIEDTFSQVPLVETAARLNIHPSTAWRMRHKLLRFLEELAKPVILEDQVEFDEKYELVAKKGVKELSRPARHRGENATKRGLSNEQFCMITGVQRQADSVLMTVNLGNPSGADIDKMAPHLSSSTSVWIDGKTSYNHLLSEKECDVHVLGNYITYTPVNHLNNVNAYHSAIDEWYERYRGVSTKYINRYSALFRLRRLFGGWDLQEILLAVLRKLRTLQGYFYIRTMRTEDLFIYG